MIRIKKTDMAKKVEKKIQALANAPKKASKLAMTRIGNESLNIAIPLSPVLSGNLKRSLNSRPETFRVRFGSNLIYARIQDLGGTILPKRKKMLAWKKNGKWHFAKKVKIPKYKGRGFLTPAFLKMKRGEAKKIYRQEMAIFLKK
jgi:phage gpG-like protein